MKKIVLALFCLPLLAMAGEAGTALKADNLLAEPFADAKSTGVLNKGDNVEIISKKGAWLEVKNARGKGWVRLLSVKRASSGNGLQGAVDIASGRAGTGKVVSTTGIRGLSAEELKTAKFNEAEMKKLESYQSTAAAAQGFADAGGLKASKIDFLKGSQP